MAGLVVIDFIDMEYNNNIRKVEKAMKDALKNDRARIQVGRISGFGLMEMSRQRLRTGVLEATTRQCPHCDGTGLVRTASSAGLSALRLIEDEAAKGKGSIITLYASTEAAVYMLNAKRADLAEIEDRYGVSVEVLPEGEDEGAKMRVASSGPRPTTAPKFAPIVDDIEDDPIEDEVEDEIDEDEGDDRNSRSRRDDDEDDGPRKRRRKRGGRNRRDREDGDAPAKSDETLSEDDQPNEARDSAADDQGEEDRPKKRRRRGGRRRRGRGKGEGENGTDETVTADDAAALDNAVGETVGESIAVVAGPDGAPQTAEAAGDEAPAKPKRTRRKKADADAPAAEEPATAEAPTEEAPSKPRRTRKKKADVEAEAPAAAPESVKAPAAEAQAKPRRSRAKKAKADEPVSADPVTVPADEPIAANDTNGAGEGANQPAKRGGWWQRTFGE